MYRSLLLVWIASCAIGLPLPVVAAEPTTAAVAANEPVCFTGGAFKVFWSKVGQRVCLKCHHNDGDAAGSELLLGDEFAAAAGQRGELLAKNYAAMVAIARQSDDGQSRLLLKARGELDHGGGEVLAADSSELRLLQQFVASVSGEPAATPSPVDLSQWDDDLGSFFDGLEMISDQRLLRRLTLSLAGRLPSDAERQTVRAGGLAAIEPLLAEIMREDGFYERLLEGFNDIFLTLGYTGLGLDALAYNHFDKSRLWYQKHSLDHLPEEERQKARYKLSNQYNESLRREPLELLRYIVKNDRPFTEIVTADYTTVSPYSARGYGVFETIRDQFEDPDAPFEYIPTRIPALTARSGKVQPTEDGFYPHSGLLTMFQYLRRYPTTETNRNRLRARMYYQHFLGVDIMNLAPRVSDAAAVEAQYEIPTMQAASCVICHRTIDPIAGLFQDYYNEDGHYGPRKDGWFEDMFPPGREGTGLPEDQQLRRLQWLGQQTASDPRFATAMAGHVYYILTGRRPLEPPEDIDSKDFAARRRAYLAQRDVIAAAAERFVRESYNLKVLFQSLALSPLYRADALADGAASDEQLAAWDEVGVVRMLGPEQLERKIAAVFGKPWGRLDGTYGILYGGIDSKEVTQRLSDPSGAVGSLQRIMANDVACKNVAADFKLPPQQRRLFPGIEPDVVPSSEDPEAEQKIRAAIVHLHQHILGREDSPDHPEVDMTYDLLATVVAEATAREQYDKTESYFCKSSGSEGPRDPDPHYTIRAWRAVVTYLLRQPDFLYE
jgi:hypothetical protein